jgi:DNA-binding CsgD family transcriptional regulator
MDENRRAPAGCAPTGFGEERAAADLGHAQTRLVPTPGSCASGYDRDVTAGEVAGIDDLAGFAATDLGRLVAMFGRLPLELVAPIVGYDILERCELDGYIRVDVARGASTALVSCLAMPSGAASGVVRQRLVERLAGEIARHEVMRCPPDVAQSIGLVLVEARAPRIEYLVRAIRSALILIDFDSASTMLAFAQSHDGSNLELMHLRSMLLEASGEHGAAMVVANDFDAANDSTWLGRWASNLFLATGTVAANFVPEPDDTNNEYAANLAWVRAFTGDVAAVASTVTTVINDPLSSPQAVLWCCVAGSFTAALNGQCSVATRLLDLGDSILDAHASSLTPFAAFQMRGARLLVLTRVGRLADARQMTIEQNLGSGFDSTAVRRFGALASREAGHPQHALDLLAADSGPIGGDPFRFQPWVDSETAVCRALLGTSADSFDVSRPPDENATGAAMGVYEACLFRNRSWVLAALGHIEDARSVALDAFALAQLQSQRAIQLLAALDLARFGRPHQATELIVDVDGDGPLFAVGAATIVALADDKVDPLVAAARLARRHGFDLLASELGARAANTAEARHDPCLQARIELTAPVLVTLHTPLLLAARRPARLTNRESEVASAAGTRASSQKIATSLGVSVRTVDNLLGKVYMKAALTGRGDLKAMLNGDLLVEPSPRRYRIQPRVSVGD